jgi:hypothetical protein
MTYQPRLRTPNATVLHIEAIAISEYRRRHLGQADFRCMKVAFYPGTIRIYALVS